MIEDCQLLLRLLCPDVPDVHFTEKLHGHHSTMEELWWQRTRIQSPGEEEVQWWEVGRERGCGLVVGGNTQVGVQLWTKTKKKKETGIERERERQVIGGWQGVLQGKARVFVCVLATRRSAECLMAESVMAD